MFPRIIPPARHCFAPFLPRIIAPALHCSRAPLFRAPFLPRIIAPARLFPRVSSLPRAIVSRAPLSPAHPWFARRMIGWHSCIFPNPALNDSRKRLHVVSDKIRYSCNLFYFSPAVSHENFQRSTPSSPNVAPIFPMVFRCQDSLAYRQRGVGPA